MAFLARRVLLAAALALLCAASQLAAAALQEYQVKAVFLFNFSQFVEWPADAFETADSPLTIGVLGKDPFGHFLDDTAKGELVNGRPLVVRRYRTIDEVDRCHILFISGSEGPRAGPIFLGLKGRSVLTVRDWEGSTNEGGVVLFLVERGRVRLRINLEAAKDAKLSISSKLLRAAETVTLGATRR